MYANNHVFKSDQNMSKMIKRHVTFKEIYLIHIFGYFNHPCRLIQLSLYAMHMQRIRN